MNFTKKQLREFFKQVYGTYPPTSATKNDLMIILNKEDELRGGGLFDIFKSMTKKAKSIIKFKTRAKVAAADFVLDKTLGYRETYTNETRNTLNNYGEQIIADITVVKTPVQKMLISVINVLSYGLFKELMEQHGFDKMFHLGIIVNVNGKRIIIEKLAEVNISTNYKKGYSELSETLELNNYQQDIKLNDLMNKTRSYMGDRRYYDYDAFKNNCQNFIQSILKANNLLTDTANNFIYQDLTQMYKVLEDKTPYLATTARLTTRLGAMWNRITGSGIMDKKEFPLNYGIQAEEAIKLVSFNVENVNVMGSMAMKAFKYPSDIDLFETVKTNDIKKLANEFQDNVYDITRTKNIYITDCKIGEIPELEVLNNKIYFKNGKIIGYDKNKSLTKLKEIKQMKIITAKEYNELKPFLSDNPTEAEYNLMLKLFRFQVLRWSSKEILQGYKKIGEYKITIEDAIKSNAMFKLDIVAFINNKFTEITAIYDIRDEKNKRINNYQVKINEQIKENIEALLFEGEYYKALKRNFSILKYNYKFEKGDKRKTTGKQMNDLLNIFNGDLGLINSVKNDIDVILSLYEIGDDLPTDKIINMMNQFIYRLSNVYKEDSFKKEGADIIKDIKKAISEPSKIQSTIKEIQTRLKTFVNIKAKKYI